MAAAIGPMFLTRRQAKPMLPSACLLLVWNPFLLPRVMVFPTVHQRTEERLNSAERFLKRCFTMTSWSALRKVL